MQRTAVLALTAAAVAATLLTGCADGSDDDENPCGRQQIVYVEDNDTYHCGSPTGMVVAAAFISVDTQKRAKATPGKPVSFSKPAAQTPKVVPPKPAKPAAPAPKAPAAPRPAGKR